ncbi:MAG: hypothetical protein POELPBGB_02085 [Bacteroidia bacterium]|nr:hypothetical protein [Bacteroidia bacterium]
MIQQSTLKFLSALKKNNNRDWFLANKKDYDAAKKDFIDYVQKLIAGISVFDKKVSGLEAKNCVFRINRDVRFSHDKSPYKSNMGANMSQGGKKSPAASYYFHLEPGGSFLAGGIWQPEPDKLKALREDILYEPDDFKKIIGSKEFKKHYSRLWDEGKLKTAPKGFDKEHPDIDLIKYKSYIVVKNLSDREVLDKTLLKNALEAYKTVKPLNDFLNKSVGL